MAWTKCARGSKPCTGSSMVLRCSRCLAKTNGDCAHCCSANGSFILASCCCISRCPVDETLSSAHSIPCYLLDASSGILSNHFMATHPRWRIIRSRWDIHSWNFVANDCVDICDWLHVLLWWGKLPDVFKQKNFCPNLVRKSPFPLLYRHCAKATN